MVKIRRMVRFTNIDNKIQIMTIESTKNKLSNSVELS